MGKIIIDSREFDLQDALLYLEQLQKNQELEVKAKFEKEKNRRLEEIQDMAENLNELIMNFNCCNRHLIFVMEDVKKPPKGESFVHCPMCGIATPNCVKCWNQPYEEVDE